MIGRETGDAGSRILLVDLTPDLVVLLRRTFAAIDIRVLDPADDLDRLLVDRWDALVVDLHSDRLGEVLPHRRRVPIVGITSSVERAADRGELAAVLVRPVLGDDLLRTIGRLLGDDDGHEPAADRLARATARLPVARLTTLGVGIVLQLLGPDATGNLGGLLVLTALVWGAVRLRTLGRSTVGIAADVVLAAALLGLTGGPHSVFVFFAWLVAAEAGLLLRPRLVTWSVLTLLLAAFPSGVAAGQPGAVRAWAATLVIFPCAAVIGVLARRLWSVEVDDVSADLAEAHRALTTVLTASGRLPGGLAMPDAATAMLAEVARRWKASAGMVLVEQGGAFVEAGSVGLSPHEPLVLGPDHVLAADMHEGVHSHGVADVLVPPALRLSVTTSHPWTLTPLRHDGVAVAAILWTGSRHLNDRSRIQLRGFAKRAGLAVSTARLFEQLRSLAADRDRVKVREALGSDVFQNVISLRYELEMLGMGAESAPLRPQLDRLGALARDVAAQVRTTADRMGSDLDASGLAAALRHHCRDLERLVPGRIDVHVQPQQRPVGEAEIVMYELATAAVHSSIATPGVTHVQVRLLGRDGATVIEVDDDGVPAAAPRSELMGMATGAGQLGVSLRLSTTRAGNRVLITAAPVGLRATGGVS